MFKIRKKYPLRAVDTANKVFFLRTAGVVHGPLSGRGVIAWVTTNQTTYEDELYCYENEKQPWLLDAVIEELRDLVANERRRGAPRASFHGAVTIVKNDVAWAAQGLDISDGGILVECASIGLRPGDEVCLVFTPGAGEPESRVIAQLVRQTRRRDCAFEFVTPKTAVATPTGMTTITDMRSITGMTGETSDLGPGHTNDGWFI